jgi:hypothetical protein
MTQQELLSLYALALRLVPDPDEAGDLFMAARSADHLRLLADRWRLQKGYLAAPPDAVGDPEALTGEQLEEALHQIRRWGRRRRQERIMLGGAAAVLLVAVLVGAWYYRPGDPLLRDPAFGGEPLTVESVQGRSAQLAIYRMEATPGSVTAWWTVGGQDADGYLAPKLEEKGGLRLDPAERATARDRRGTVYGKTTYRTITAGLMGGILTLVSTESNKVEARAGAPFTWVDDPGAQVVRLDRQIHAVTGEWLATLESVTLGANYTLLRFQPEQQDVTLFGIDQTGSGGFGSYTFNLPGFGLYRPVRPVSDGVVEYVLGPVEEGVQTITAQFRWESLPSLVTTLEPGKITFEQSGTTAQATVNLYEGESLAVPLFIDRHGQTYPGLVRSMRREGMHSTWEVEVANLPPDAKIIDVIGYLSQPMVTVPIDLKGIVAASSEK